MLPLTAGVVASVVVGDAGPDVAVAVVVVAEDPVAPVPTAAALSPAVEDGVCRVC